MKMKLSWIFGLAALAWVLTILFWPTPWETAEIADASQPATLTWLAPPGTSPNGISIRVAGVINGKADISDSHGDLQTLGGRVDWRTYHDWFQPRIQFFYVPRGKVTGKLVIRYRFER